MSVVKGTGPQPLRVRGVGRMEDEPRSLLVCLSDIPSDAQLRSLHEFLRDWTPLGPAHRNVLRNLQFMATDVLNADRGEVGYELREFAADGHQQVCAALAAGEPPKNEAEGAAQRGEETGWVIEREDSEPSRPLYYAGFQWEYDNLKAMRFARKEDAQTMSKYMFPGEPHRITDHMWCP